MKMKTEKDNHAEKSKGGLPGVVPKSNGKSKLPRIILQVSRTSGSVCSGLLAVMPAWGSIR